MYKNRTFLDRLSIDSTCLFLFFFDGGVLNEITRHYTQPLNLERRVEPLKLKPRTREGAESFLDFWVNFMT